MSLNEISLRKFVTNKIPVKLQKIPPDYQLDIQLGYILTKEANIITN